MRRRGIDRARAERPRRQFGALPRGRLVDVVRVERVAARAGEVVPASTRRSRTRSIIMRIDGHRRRSRSPRRAVQPVASTTDEPPPTGYGPRLNSHSIGAMPLLPNVPLVQRERVQRAPVPGVGIVALQRDEPRRTRRSAACASISSLPVHADLGVGPPRRVGVRRAAGRRRRTVGPARRPAAGPRAATKRFSDEFVPQHVRVGGGSRSRRSSAHPTPAACRARRPDPGGPSRRPCTPRRGCLPIRTRCRPGCRACRRR